MILAKEINRNLVYTNIIYNIYSANYVKKISYVSTVAEILNRKLWKNYCNRLNQPFFLCSTSSKERNREFIINKLIQQYNIDKIDLVNRKILPHYAIPQIDKLIQQVSEFENEKNELEAFHQQDIDPELKVLAIQDVAKLKENITSIKEELYDNLLHFQSPSEINEIYFEISAGVGGQESMLFAQDLLEMYTIFCSLNGWNGEIISCDKSDIGGIRKACMLMKGSNVYTKLRFEGGIHRVQRVPKTEKSGRIHTSTVSVAILPVPSEVTIHLNPKDLKIETMRASGAGGQHVNKVESAVRITHLPSGVVTTCQTNRAQDQNKNEALRKLSAILYEREIDEQQAKFSSEKKLQVGTKARSEKIRTYNFVQDRVTDHRLGMSIYNIAEILRNGQSLDKIITALIHTAREEQLSEACANAKLPSL